MIKKILALFLATASFSLTACTNNTNDATTIEEDEYITEDLQITNADDALARLKEGNKRFINDDSQLINVTSERRDQLVDEQNPYAIIVSCSDSRSDPSVIFNTGLGEIFDIRIAGNVVDDTALGSIEYAIEHLHSPLLVIMGHESCGGVTAAYDYVKNGTEAGGNLESIVDKIAPAIQGAETLDDAVHMNIDGVYTEVLKDEIIQTAVNNGSLSIVKAYYALDGTVTFE